MCRHSGDIYHTQEDEQGMGIRVAEKLRESVIIAHCILGTKQNLEIQTQRHLLLMGFFFSSGSLPVTHFKYV